MSIKEINMKKIQELIKPVLMIIFGALILLFYMNFINSNYAGGYIALGIIGVVFAAYYLTIGILNLLIGKKLGKVFDILNIDLFAILMFTQFLIITIYGADNMGPTGWVIKILSMIAALTLAAFFIVFKLVNVPVIKRLTMLFAGIFALAMLLDILFDDRGFGDLLGNINMISLAIYAIFASILFSNVLKEDAPKEVENKEE